MDNILHGFYADSGTVHDWYRCAHKIRFRVTAVKIIFRVSRNGFADHHDTNAVGIERNVRKLHTVSIQNFGMCCQKSFQVLFHR
jgi:hypothetical protein